MNTLAISETLSLPDEAVTKRIAIVGQTGSGKTYTAMVIVEEMYKRGIHLAFLDPLGVGWGLRLDADGKRPGLPIIVLGGPHGDAPLTPDAGKQVAQLVVEHGLSVIIDLSEFSGNEQDRFALAFADELFHLNRKPLHLIVDEADSFAPQTCQPGQQRMLGAFDRLARKGRIRGIGMTSVTQRPALLNKNVLTQSDCLIVGRLTGPQDRDAIQDFIVHNTTKDEKTTILGSLGTLGKGQAWVISAGWLEKLEQIQVRRRTTFDSSSTPELGKDRPEPQKLADINLTHLRELLAIPDAKEGETDTMPLRRRVKELEAEVKRLETRPTVAAFRPDDWSEIQRLYSLLGEASKQVGGVHEHLRHILCSYEPGETNGVPQIIRDVTHRADLAEDARHRGPLAERAAPIRELKPKPEPISLDGAGLEGLSRPQRNILFSIRRLEVLCTTAPRRGNVAALSGVSGKSGSFANNLSTLRTAGFVTYPSGSTVALTDAARALIPSKVSPTQGDLMAAWRGILSGPQFALLEVIAHAYPKPLLRASVAEAVGVSSTSGSFANNLSTLRSHGLIDYPDGKTCVATGLLFPAGVKNA